MTIAIIQTIGYNIIREKFMRQFGKTSKYNDPSSVVIECGIMYYTNSLSHIKELTNALFWFKC